MVLEANEVSVVIANWRGEGHKQLVEGRTKMKIVAEQKRTSEKVNERKEMGKRTNESMKDNPRDG
jgi:hypothetical protein